jgi:dTDP-4-dehydrorhamnose reductase
MIGPHEHEAQTVWFISLYSKMLYVFVYKDVSHYFITDADKIYRIKVEPGVIHSYINLSVCRVAQTANFPSSLFMGCDKKDEIDEIRHEPVVEKNKNIYVLGAGGRLGKAITDRLLSDMGMHTYNVIPVFEKFDDTEQGRKSFNAFLDMLVKRRIDEHDMIINCIAKTNVQNHEEKDEYTRVNYQLSRKLTEFCVKNRFYFIHFSTDYVFQKGELSPYTLSKVEYENWLNHFYENAILDQDNISQYIRIIRLANLFSLDKKDIHNMFNKLYSNCMKHDTMYVPKDLVLMPTEVTVIAEYLRTFIDHIDEKNLFTNVAGKPYKIQQVISDLFQFDDLDIQDVPEEDLTVMNHPELFLRNCVMLECSEQIIKKIQQIKG